MGILSFLDSITPATTTQLLSSLLANAGTVGLPATAWQTGGVARTILAIVAAAQAGQDALVSMAAQGGLLDFAATGTVTFTNPNGQTVTVPVTPDPSIPAQWPNPGSQPVPGWLDFLADSTYNVQRIQATNASGVLWMANTSGSGTSTFGPGTYHVANPLTGLTYSNTGSLTINASSVIGGSVSNVTNSSGLYQVTTASAHGLSTGALVYITGVQGTPNVNSFWIVTVVNTTQFTLNQSTFAGSYTSGGTVYSGQTANFQADQPGPAYTSSPGKINQPVTSILGVFLLNPFTFTGAPVEGNVALAARCRLKIQSLNPNGPAGAYAYFALTAFQLLQNQTVGGMTQAGSLLSTPITQALVTTNTATGTVTTTLANAAGPATGVANLAITNATMASPIVVTVSSTSGMGSDCLITGVGGNTAANGYWQIAVINGTTFSLTGSSGNGAYTSGGTVEAGDVGLVDSLIQANVVPNAVTAITQGATTFNVAIVLTAYVPSALAGVAAAAISAALTAFFVTIPIGGYLTGVPTPNTLPFETVEGAINDAVPYIRALTMTLNGGTTDLGMSAFEVAVMSPAASITVVPF